MQYDKLSKDQYASELRNFQFAYYESDNPLISDEEYDSLVSLYEKKFNEKYTNIGIQRDCKLPVYTGSLDKIKTEKELNLFLSKYKGPFTITDKVDGISAIYEPMKQKLYTRGDGVKGSDISHLLPYLKLPKSTLKVIRGEFVIHKATFEKKYYPEHKNPRNLVSGAVSRKTPDKNILSDLMFYPYYTYEKTSSTNQLLRLKKENFNNLWNTCVSKETLTVEKCTELFYEREKLAPYEIDGLVITAEDECTFPFNETPVLNSNPKNSLAFKVQGKSMKTKVINVEWNISRYGVYKPIIIVEPVKIEGATISKVSGHNARYIKDNGIGIDSEIEIIRSGSVIPKVISVLVKKEPLLPTGNVKWNENEVEMCIDEDNEEENKDQQEELQLRKLTDFFKGIKVKGLSGKTIEKMYKNGMKTVFDILTCTEEDLLQLPKVQIKSAQNIRNSIDVAINEISMEKLMAASNIFGIGFGERKCKLILDNIPDLLEKEYTKQELEEKLEEIKGIDKMSDLFIDNFPKFKKFLDDHPMFLNKKNIDVEDVVELEEETKDNKKDLKDYVVVFTEVRDKEVEKEIKNRGGKIDESVTKKTTHLVVLTKENETTKMKKAKQYEIEMYEMDEFKNLIGK